MTNDRSTDPTRSAETIERRRILIATGLGAVVAIIVLVLFILPAEYGIDPTGVGALTGLDRLSGDSGTAGGQAFVAADGPPQNTTVTFVLAPGGDTEYKLFIDHQATILFHWHAENATVYYDFHGDIDAANSDAFISHDEGNAEERAGSLQAPFEGRHGWYFRNTSDQQVTVTLEIWGHYDIIGRLF